MPETKKQIWDTLFKVDVSEHVKFLSVGAKSLPYLPWPAMHVLMMQNFPEYSWSFSEDHHMREAHYFEGGSCEVRCTMTIGEHTIITSLAVTDSDEAESNPSASLIATAKQRCRVKAAAEFGLGFSLWHDSEQFTDEAPAPSKKEPQKKANYISEEEYFAKHVAAKASRAEAQAGKKKLLGALKNRKKPLDGVEQLWAELCTEKGWAI